MDFSIKKNIMFWIPFYYIQSEFTVSWGIIVILIVLWINFSFEDIF